MAPRPILIVAPWLEGGGGQAALKGVVANLPQDDIRLLVIFRGNRNFEGLTQNLKDVVFLDLPRTMGGVIRAAFAVRAYVGEVRTVYSLMRASHIVLGIASRSKLRGRRFAATFHQLPSTDNLGVRGHVETWLVKRATSVAGLITAPSHRAVEELKIGRYGSKGRIHFEANRISESALELRPPRTGTVDRPRLLMAGRLSAQKGLDRIPSLLNGLSQNVELLVVGSGELEQSVPALLKKVDSRHEVRLEPYVEDVTPLIDWCDSLLMPSKWELNPMLVWEGWARGRPVFASNLPVFEDLTESGPVLTFGNPAELDVMVRSLTEDPNLRLKYFDEGRHSVQHASKVSKLERFLMAGSTEGQTIS